MRPQALSLSIYVFILLYYDPATGRHCWLFLLFGFNQYHVSFMNVALCFTARV